MGYTHYWDYKVRKEDSYVMDTMKVLSQIKHMIRMLPQYSTSAGGYYSDPKPENKIVLRGGLGTGSPEFTSERIWFNGDEKHGMDHETFYFSFNEIEDKFTFCKTARKPYDFVVCICLLSLANNLDGFKFSSDGEIEDWQPAIEFYENIFGKLKPHVLNCFKNDLI